LAQSSNNLTFRDCSAGNVRIQELSGEY